MDAPLIRSARAGHIVLFWSPAIIAEASKVLLWIWLQKRGGRMTDGLKREAFDVARRWFAVMTTVFRVVEGCPPYAPQWTDSPRDEDDRPLWTAAVNASADVVVTANLKDGPPSDDDGIQTWNRTMYFHPDVFVRLLGEAGHFYETGVMLPSGESGTSSGSVTVTEDVGPEPEFAPETYRFLRMIELRAQSELPPAGQPE